MSCVSLLCGVFELAADTLVLGLAVVWLIDVSTKEWLRSDGQALAREERTADTLYLQLSGPQPVLHHGPVQCGSMFLRLAWKLSRATVLMPDSFVSCWISRLLTALGVEVLVIWVYECTKRNLYSLSFLLHL